MIKLSGEKVGQLEIDLEEEVDAAIEHGDNPTPLAAGVSAEAEVEPEEGEDYGTPEPEESEEPDQVEEKDAADNTDTADDPMRDYARRVQEAHQVVKLREGEYEDAKEEAKEAKHAWENAVKALGRIIDAGPEVMPLFDQPRASDSTIPLAEGVDADYLPALEKGQYRLRITKFDWDEADMEKPAPFAVGDVILATLDDDGDLSWGETEEDKTVLDESMDGWEVLEEWPDDAEEPTRHETPIACGLPGEGSDSASVDEEEEAEQKWRPTPIEELRLPKGVMAKLKEAGCETIGQLEDFRGEITLGRAEWPKGIGPAKVDQIEEVVLDWLKVNQ